MKKALKWIGIVVGGLLGLVLIIVVGLNISVRGRINKTYDIQVQTFAIPSDEGAIERGEHWVLMLCTGCHGDDLAGTAFFEDPALGSIPASNLTSGEGGVGGTYGDEDWIRAIRHGVNIDGNPLMIMPAGGFYYLSEGDLGDIIAYVKSVPAVDNQLGDKSLSLIAYVLAGFGAFGDFLAAELIDHESSPPSVPTPGVTAAYGEYLATISDCRSCHGSELSGGKPSNPDSPSAPNLTPGGVLVGWSEADFIATLRTGTDPYNRELNPEFMPWETMGLATDDQLTAIFLYLQSLPSLATSE
ncbi:MAG: cytochrome c [Chloroflexi bacterium]|nr:cytochrome c [Chloroflexota bacterium]